MSKKLIITEKPSVAREFAKAIGESMKSLDGYMESDNYIITWCFGHLVTMCYPDAYNEALKRWSMESIPFIPTTYKYSIIPDKKKQFNLIKSLFHREDVIIIYNAGDSGREGEYIQRLVKQEAGFRRGIEFKRIWIDSQTEEEILRGIAEAKDESFYDNLSEAAYLRAKEDYLMGINFSRALTLRFGNILKSALNADRAVIAVGRVMTCVQGMVVNKEREIRAFTKTKFYKLNGEFIKDGFSFLLEWRYTENSIWKEGLKLYKDMGFLSIEEANSFIDAINAYKSGTILKVEKKKQLKNPPLLYNLAELQNDCSRLFKLSPDETLKIAQELYERKMTTYPRTDARVLSSAVGKEIIKNLRGISKFPMVSSITNYIIEKEKYKGILKTRYVDDKQITDHYAIIPTGAAANSYDSLSPNAKKVYEIILRRFLSIFLPPAEFKTIQINVQVGEELFTGSFKATINEGYLPIFKYSFMDKSKNERNKKEDESETRAEGELGQLLDKLKKGMTLNINGFSLKEGETTPPKRYTSGSIILAMENAGSLIEDEELRSQIKGSGIGTSATRAEILKKLFDNGYLALNKKTQVISPTYKGEAIYELVLGSIKPLLDPSLTASWEKGLTGVAAGEIEPSEYVRKLNDFVSRRTNIIKEVSINSTELKLRLNEIKKYYS